ncbi:MAG: hypothetical protein CFE28_08390 [Alphaproteobacteria bacterium PA2]|nr:MAG: hypothetical protein CFE28_08390 [Alphaproteobacteria bacterium PA2]
MDPHFPELDPWLERWGLVQDGWAFQTPYTRSILAPVLAGGRKAMLKIAGSPEEAAGARLMAWWSGRGAAPVLEAEGDVIVLERAEDPDGLARMAFDGKDDEATRILCQVVETLHRPRSEPTPDTLRPLSDWFRALKAARERHPVFEKAAALAEGLLAETESPVILHGDVTHQNVLGFGDKGWLAIDPKGLFGDRAYDYANIFRSPTTAMTTPTRLRRQADVMSECSGLESRTLLQWGFVHAALSVAWWLENGHSLNERALRIPGMNLAVLEAG